MEEIQQNVNPNTLPKIQIKPTKPWFKIVLSAVLGLTLVGTIVFIGYQLGKRKAQPVSQPIPTPTAVIVLTPTPTKVIIPTQSTTFAPTLKPAHTIIPDQTTNWKIYTNTKYKFEIKYPADKKEVIDSEDPFIGFCDLNKAEVAIKLYNSDQAIPPRETEFSGYLVVSIDAEPNPNNIAPKDWLTQNCKGTWVINSTTENIKINGIEGIKITGKEMGLSTLVVFNKNSLMFFVYGWGPYQSTTFNQILSTFKFIDQSQTDETANWKTYKNNGLSFQYPPDWPTSDYVITSNLPKISLVVIPNDSSLMNECMLETSIETKDNFIIKKFSRVTTGEMCATSDSTPRQIWIMKSPTTYSPGIIYNYSSTESSQAEAIFDQISSTFKFLD